jgi:1-deoxy-D-xylulose-5-phosphate synthase
MAFEALNYLGESKEDVLIILNDNNSAIDANVGALANEKKYPAFFESLGLNYLGDCDGHNLAEIIPALQEALKIKGPKVLRVLTKRVEVETPQSALEGYTAEFVNTLCRLAETDERIVAISPAMLSGSGLNEFQKQFPNRCFDVGIAEQHAVTFAAGLAKGGKKPICHLYSTFSQRAIDQIIHDVALQNLPVVFLLDRAGLVGNDGATHHGVFDVALLSSIPNIEILAPASASELSVMLEWAVMQDFPVAIRYPRTGGAIPPDHNPRPLELHRMETILKGNEKLAVINFGFLLGEIEEALKDFEANPFVFNLRFAKRLSAVDLKTLSSFPNIWVIEDSQKRGGVGEYLAQQLFEIGYTGNFHHSGLPDEFVEHGTMQELYEQYGLTHIEFKNRFKKFLR